AITHGGRFAGKKKDVVAAQGDGFTPAGQEAENVAIRRPPAVACFESFAGEAGRSGEAADFSRCVLAIVPISRSSARFKLAVDVGAVSAKCVLDAVAASEGWRGQKETAGGC